MPFILGEMGHFLVRDGRHMPVGEFVGEVRAATAAVVESVPLCGLATAVRSFGKSLSMSVIVSADAWICQAEGALSFVGRGGAMAAAQEGLDHKGDEIHFDGAGFEPP